MMNNVTVGDKVQFAADKIGGAYAVVHLDPVKKAGGGDCPVRALVAKMGGMRLTPGSRSMMAMVAALLMLLCQTAYATRVCAHQGTASSSAAGAAPCHEAQGGSDTVPRAAPNVCEAATAAGDAAKVPVYALTDLPVVAISYSRSAAGMRTPHAPQTVHAVCYSPPLTLLHCRLLN